MSLQLGQFSLNKIIGGGAMGDVWAGVHVKRELPVAVKVMSRSGDWKARHIEYFRNEVKAVARLNHPGIVMVFDYGEITAENEAASDKMLTAGTPFLAMELAPFGSLERLQLPLSWEALKSVLLSIFDALAHAHARGVIHRDIKPANVLITSEDMWAQNLKLTDFGIAHSVEDRDRTGSTEVSLGTPSYMAPEQFEGRWRDYGPWTDIYAVGCMAYELVTGRQLFEADSFMSYAYKHLRVEPDPLPEGLDIPPGFEEWLMRLLEKDPRRRFLRAADAAWALFHLDPDDKIVSSQMPAFAVGWTEQNQTEMSLSFHIDSERGLSPLAIDTAVRTGPNTSALDSIFSPRESDPPVMDDPMVPRGVDAPPPPVSWRRVVPPPPSMKLVGAGLGLFGLRALPLVGREEERDLIWNKFHDTRADGQVHLLLCSGASGLGKSRLMEWMCERAHELGAATIFSAMHSPTGGPGDGLPRMVSRHLGCIGLDKSETLERVERQLRKFGVEDEYEWLGLTQLISPEEGNPLVEFSTPTQWYSLVQRLIERACEERPVIVWLDDVQWGADAIGLAAHLLSQRSEKNRPILVLMTAREDALESRPVERSKIEQMMLKGGVSREISLAPLDSGERALLIGELLGLEGELASQVEDRCGGNPLFAVQLIGDWVERGVLEVADAGFKLRANEKAVVPDNIHQLMTARIERLLKDKPPVARTALELAATLGQDYEDEEWLAVCALAGFVPPASLVEDLLSGSLIKKTPRGWLFRHGMLRESIARQALESGRSKNHNFLCAQMLVDRNENFSRRAAMRLGLHCYAAGRLPMAGRYFFKAAVLHLEAGEYSQSLEALAQSEAARKELAVPESDAELGRHMLLRADVWKRQGRLDDSKSLSAQVEVLARRHGWENLLPLALQNTGDVARIQGDMLEAQQTYQVALGLFEGGDNQAGQAQVLSCLADICCQTGDLASSKQRYGQVLELYRALGVEVGIGQTMCGLGQVALQRGALQDALRSFRGALRIFEEHGRQPQIIDCLKNLADVARFQGRFDDAMIRYRKVLAFYENIGSGEAVHTRLAIGLLKLQQGDHTGARVILEACRKVFETTNERDDLGRTHAQLIPCAAAARDWEACLHHHDRACVYLRETRRYDLDIAWSAQLGGELAKARGMTSLAIKAFRLAHQQWKISGQKERAADVAKTINALEKAGSL